MSCQISVALSCVHRHGVLFSFGVCMLRGHGAETMCLKSFQMPTPFTTDIIERALEEAKCYIIVVICRCRRSVPAGEETYIACRRSLYVWQDQVPVRRTADDRGGLCEEKAASQTIGVVHAQGMPQTVISIILPHVQHKLYRTVSLDFFPGTEMLLL